LARARGLEAFLEPGDVLYWPSFWFHGVVNLDALSLAIAAPLDEVPMSALLIRHVTAVIGSALVGDLHALSAGDVRDSLVQKLLGLLSAYETRLLPPPLAELGHFWNFQPRLPDASPHGVAEAAKTRPRVNHASNATCGNY
jgi:hypothetical protein